MSKRTLEVVILGEHYTLVSDESDEHISHSAHAINQIMHSIRQAGVSDGKKIAVLACLQLASKLLKVDAAHEALLQEKTLVKEWVERQNKTLSDFS